jgi:hypothetical protein
LRRKKRRKENNKWLDMAWSSILAGVSGVTLVLLLARLRMLPRQGFNGAEF